MHLSAGPEYPSHKYSLRICGQILKMTFIIPRSPGCHGHISRSFSSKTHGCPIRWKMKRLKFGSGETLAPAYMDDSPVKLLSAPQFFSEPHDLWVTVLRSVQKPETKWDQKQKSICQSGNQCLWQLVNKMGLSYSCCFYGFLSSLEPNRTFPPLALLLLSQTPT